VTAHRERATGHAAQPDQTSARGEKVLPLSVVAAMMGGVTAQDVPLTPIVGRGAELDRLGNLLGLGGAPRPAAVVVGGDAGVGKTRLLAELHRRAEESGWRVFVGHCLDFGDSALPYLPFSEIAGRLDALDPQAAARLASTYPALARLLPGQRILAAHHQPDGRGPAGPGVGVTTGGGGVPLGAEDSSARSELFGALHEVLQGLAAQQPVLLIIEDVHWADPSTRDLLSFLFTRGFDQPAAIVVSYRHDDLHRRHPLRRTLAEWGRLPRVTRIHLDGLPDDAVRAIVRTVRPVGLDDRAVEQIVRRAEGNAFFAEELVCAPDPARALPTDLADLLLVRLDGVTEPARAVVRAAACAGRKVPHAMLAEVLHLEPYQLDEALRDAVEANILVPIDGASYTFRHALLAEAVYDDLLPGERTRLHAAFAAALAEGRVDGTAAELARHARHALDRATAIRASIEAGQDAMSVGGPEEAADHYQTALELLGGDGALVEELGVDEVDLVLRAADALVLAGHPSRAMKLLSHRVGPVRSEVTDETDVNVEHTWPVRAPRGLAGGRQTSRPPRRASGPDLEPAQRARLLTALANTALLLDDTSVSALAATSEALDLLGPEPSVLRGKVLTIHARANADRGRFDEATRVAEQAHDLAVELGAEKLQTEAATILGRLKEFTGDALASKAALTDVAERVRRSGDVVGLIRALHQLGGINMELGLPAEALEHYREAAELARDHGRRWAPYGLDARVLAAIAAYMTGRWEEVDELTDLSGESPPPLPRGLLLGVASLVAAGRGDPNGAAVVDAVRPMWSKEGWTTILATGAAIDVHGDAGDIETALRIHDEGVDQIRRLWKIDRFQAQVRFSALLIGQLAAAAARDATAAERRRLAERGEQLLTEAQEAMDNADRLGRTLGPESAAWAARLRAEHLRLRWLTGTDTPSAAEMVAAWEEAVAAFETLGHVFEAARARARLAAVHAAEGDAAAAEAVAQSAREVAERLGALPLLAELHGVTRSRQRPTGRTEPATLTPREREVLELVAAGRTNGEIAKQLFISTKTVSVHVSNILAKLGVSGRTEAAAVARREGLVG
jgi:DNA-binding NarL/FixJ family response regulator